MTEPKDIFFRWLHLSDIHFNPSTDGVFTNDLRESLPKYILENIKPVNNLFITGDLRYAPLQTAETLVEDAVKVSQYILELKEAAKLESNSKIQMVPGNHDLTRSKSPLNIVEEIIRDYQPQIGRFDLEKLKILLNAFDFYQECEKQIYGTSFLTKETSPHYYKQIANGLVVLYLNTSFLSSKDALGNYLCIGTEYVREILEEITKSYPDSIIIVLAHHGLELLEPDENRIIKELFNKYNVQLYFCGHTHGLYLGKINNIYEITVGCIKKDDPTIDAGFVEGDLNLVNGEIKLYVHTWNSKTLSWNKDLHLGSPKEMKIEIAKPQIDKILYAKPTNYIPRVLLPFEKDKDSFSYYYLKKEKQISLYDAFLKDVNIVLLDEAGSGKTTELKNLAYELCNNENYYPVFVSLNHFIKTQEIEDFIPLGYKYLGNENLVLLLDGFDEMENEHRKAFIHKLHHYQQTYPKVHIIVASRENFYKNADYEQEWKGTLEGFAEYNIVPLSFEDAKSYIRSNITNYSDFEDRLFAQQLNTLCAIPFYLIRIVDLYNNEGDLPNHTSLMEALIKDRFNKDDCKYSPGKNLGELQFDIDCALQKIAFVMQLLQRNYLQNEEYQSLICDREVRNSLKHHGIWVNDGSNWQFEHNNFREYLTAKFLKNKPLEEITNFAVFGKYKKIIKPSWINTLGYLLTQYKDNALLHWIKENCPDQLFELEFDNLGLDEVERTKIFTNIIESYKEKNLWLDLRYPQLAALTNFSQNQEAFKFLLSEINPNQPIVPLGNALLVLRYFPSVFGYEEQTTRALLDCCLSQDVSAQNKQFAIEALAKLNLANDSITDQLMALYGNSDNQFIRAGMYKYLELTQNVDHYINFFLQGFGKFFDGDSTYVNESINLGNGLRIIKTPAAIKTVFEFISNTQNKNRDLSIEEAVLGAIVQTAIDLYNSGEKSFFDAALNIIFTLNHRNSDKVRIPVHSVGQSGRIRPPVPAYPAMV